MSTIEWIAVWLTVVVAVCAIVFAVGLPAYLWWSER
jgi:hypothetical protein